MPDGCDIGSCSKQCGGGKCCWFSKKYICFGRCNRHACPRPPPPTPLPETTTSHFLTSSTGSPMNTSAISSPFSSKEESSPTEGEVVAITAGCCIFLLVILLLIVHLLRRRSRSKPTSTGRVEGPTVVNKLYEANPNSHYLTVIYNEQDKHAHCSANGENFPGTSGALPSSETIASYEMLNQYTDIDDGDVHSVVYTPYDEVDIS
ncbi:uncharacterized protein LOC128239285 isoform X2 [Mya arenaria]|uniref:uncharacterized protein LOC128239285 isoform X2 n=1 Tax=Mya arenaria TaxID=6604 RepID=UPI0022E0B302|nr:uncharacterized protein LOC128239285 isoform X2 [Mya arenaria]